MFFDSSVVTFWPHNLFEFYKWTHIFRPQNNSGVGSKVYWYWNSRINGMYVRSVRLARRHREVCEEIVFKGRWPRGIEICSWNLKHYRRIKLSFATLLICLCEGKAETLDVGLLLCYIRLIFRKWGQVIILQCFIHNRNSSMFKLGNHVDFYLLWTSLP